VIADVNERGCIHRDLHAFNIMLGFDGKIRLIDPEASKFVENLFQTMVQLIISFVLINADLLSCSKSLCSQKQSSPPDSILATLCGVSGVF
jgi:serine/threonine protein kinase